MYDLSGQVALVTGGNGGIGLGMALGLAEAGADIAIWGTNDEKNARALAELEATGRRVRAFQCDVSDEEQVVESFAKTVAELGHVDALFANAGIGRTTKFTEMPLKQWRKVMSVNLDGAFLCLREAARHMVERGEGGSLVAISSVSAIDGAPGMQHYAASKAGLIAMMRGLAVELARYKVRCNTILPGWIETDMNEFPRQNEKFLQATTSRTPLRRWGQPADLAGVAVFLADKSIEFHTGDTLVVDGGYSIF